MCPSHALLSSQELFRRGHRQILRARRSRADSWKQCLADRTELMHIWIQKWQQHEKELHMFKPEDVPILREKSEHSLKHSTNKLYAIDIYLQRKKKYFLQWNFSGCIKHTRIGPLLSKRWTKQNKHNGICRHFLSQIGFLGFFFLFFFWLVDLLLEYFGP